MKVLLAVDGSAYSEAVLSEVALRPWPIGSEFRIFTAYELPLMPVPEAWAISANYSGRLGDAVRDQAQAISEQAWTKLTSALGTSFTVTRTVVAGSAKSAILEEAESWEADLILVGSHGSSAWERFFLGSVSQAVVSHAKCSVEVVRCKSGAATKPAAA